MQSKPAQYKTPLVVKHKRPSKLSDPFQDHGDQYTRALLSKPDHQLTWSDYQSLLGPFLPAGTYEESVYFLPLAFDLLLAEKDPGYELDVSVVWFVSEYADQLKADGILEACRNRICELLAHWTATFVVHHTDQATCREKGWNLDYADHVQHVEAICECTSSLIRFTRHADLAVGFYQDLAQSDNAPVKAAWLLELSRAQACSIKNPPTHPEIGPALNDPATLLNACRAVQKTLAVTQPSPTYWRDLLAQFDYLG
ncbi:hypothetical protein OT109_01175 [Phycisphaeraceae bacterium D3-23]